MSNDILYWSQVDIDRNEYIDRQLAEMNKQLSDNMADIEEMNKKRFLQSCRVNENINTTLQIMSDKLFGCSPLNLEEMHASIKKRLDNLTSLSETNNLQLYAMKKEMSYIDFDIVLNAMSFVCGGGVMVLFLKLFRFM